jgi:hypothetical protein
MRKITQQINLKRKARNIAKEVAVSRYEHLLSAYIL